jgi:hypothetical protein
MLVILHRSEILSDTLTEKHRKNVFELDAEMNI